MSFFLTSEHNTILIQFIRSLSLVDLANAHSAPYVAKELCHTVKELGSIEDKPLGAHERKPQDGLASLRDGTQGVEAASLHSRISIEEENQREMDHEERRSTDTVVQEPEIGTK